MRGSIYNTTRISFWACFFRQPNIFQFVRAYQRIEKLGLFDPLFYRSQVPQRFPKWWDPLAHCLSRNSSEFFSPSLLFDEKHYQKQCPSRKESRLNPLVDFALRGAIINQSPHPLIRPDFYAVTNPDIAETADAEVLNHFFTHGLREKRQPHPLVNFEYYLTNNPDVAQSGVNPLLHFLEKGGYEGRNPSKLFDTKFYIRENGDIVDHRVNPLEHFISKGVHEGRFPLDFYPDWIEKFEKEQDLDVVAGPNKLLQIQPTISIIMPVFNTDLTWLKHAIESVRAQTYRSWELCIADDGSKPGSVQAILESYSKLEPRIRVIHREETGHISAASNSALEMATGTFIGLMDHDDELSPQALHEVVLAINRCPDVDFIYSDEDKIKTSGQRTDPFFKPDWSPERILSNMYCGHFSIYRTNLVRQIGGFRVGYEGSQDYDLCLRISEVTSKVVHIPKILYHWRMIESSTAINPESKSYAYNAGLRAVQDALNRRGILGTARSVDRKEHPGFYETEPVLKTSPRVSVIVPISDRSITATDIEDTIQSIIKGTSYQNLEIIVAIGPTIPADFESRIASELESESNGNVGVHRSKETTFSGVINSAVAFCQSEFVALFDPDLRILSDHWIQLMLARAQYESCGVVGAKLLTQDDFIFSSGLVLRGNEEPAHNHQGYSLESKGYFGHLILASNCSAVSSQCFFVDRSLFSRIGGFDSRLTSPWAETDFCLRLSDQGYLHVFEPRVTMKFGKSRKSEPGPGRPSESSELMKKRWGARLEPDPYFNPNLLTYDGFEHLRDYSATSGRQTHFLTSPLTPVKDQ